MTNAEYEAAIERKIPWSFLGFFAGTVFGLIGIYSVFFYSREPDLNLQIQSKAPVISVREEVPNLEIILNGTDVRKSRQGISLLILKLSNIGNFPITTADFDPKEPFILEVVDGEIIRSTILDKSEPYFETVWKDVKIGTNTLTFPSFIFEPKQFFIIKFLVIHDEKETPHLRSQGKIARVGAINVVDATEGFMTNEEKQTVLGGNSKTQLIRIIFYGFGTLGTILILTYLILFTKLKIRKVLKERRRGRRRAKALHYLSTLDSDTASRLRQFVPLVTELHRNFSAMPKINKCLDAIQKSNKDFETDMKFLEVHIFQDVDLPLQVMEEVEKSLKIKIDKKLANELKKMIRFLS